LHSLCGEPRAGGEVLYVKQVLSQFAWEMKSELSVAFFVNLPSDDGGAACKSVVRAFNQRRKQILILTLCMDRTCPVNASMS